MKSKAVFKLFTSLIVIIASSTTLALAAPSEPVVKQNATQVQSSIEKAVPFNAVAPAPVKKGEIVHYTLEAKLAKLEVAPGDVKEVWTFNGSVPGPTLRVNQGDTVRFTLVNKDPNMSHGLDFHAAQADMGKYHQAIKPGESITFDWKANYPGVFYYHCSADPVIMHIANGMFGAVIVDPPGYTPEGKEYVLIQNEWYENSTDLNELITAAPQHMAFNGVAFQYMDAPLTAEAGEKVRLYFVNSGINKFSAFHVIGTIFDKVLLDGNPKNTLHGVQTVAVPPGGALIAELYADEGVYAILTHAMKDAMKGALGVLQVGKADVSSAEGHGHGPAPTPAPAPATVDKGTAVVEVDKGQDKSKQVDVAVGSKTISMKNFAFSPSKLIVKVGTTVTWKNDEAALHNIVADSFDSRDEFKDGFGKGGHYKHIFDTAGTFDFWCTLHPFMKGTITVE
ncbi:MAG: multicopper oxidase domain-containing protein [Paenibacillaceae bacterium]